jgi:serine/threonine-protein kinase
MDPQQGIPQPDHLIGQTIGNYLVTQKLGEGGMGSVYLAEHPAIGKKVALKVLHSEFSTNQEVAQRFFQEAKAVNDIGHPNIVDIVDFGVIQSGMGREQLVYFIMEYLPGATLSQLIRAEAPLPPERALGIGLQIADALGASHKCGIVHRDIKPDNVILLQRGRERDFVKLLDFGIAKLTSGSVAGSHKTRAGLVMGTPAYMSPEQCEGASNVDSRTDIYALGVVLYEMLTGRVPFLGTGYSEILVKHLTQSPTPPSQFLMMSPHVELVVLKALEKRADLRYPTMDEFMRAMADPVGYVEVNGGVTGFLMRQLMPSNAPLPSGIRLPTQMTPLPGTLIAPVGPGPTTLSSVSGQLQAPKARTLYIVVAAVIVAVAAAAIVVVAGRDKSVPTRGSDVVAGNAGGSDRGSSVAGALGSSAPAPIHTPSEPVPSSGGNATPGSAATGSAAAGSATTGSGAAAGSAAGDGSNTAGSDAVDPSGSDASGSGATAPAEEISIDVNSSPEGARISVDGHDAKEVTPAKLRMVRERGKTVTISLRLKGYNTVAKTVDISESSKVRAELSAAVARSRPANPVPPGPGSAVRPPVVRPPPPPTQPPVDPDGLIRP